MRRCRLLALIAPFVVSVAAEAAEPPAFKGIRLGIGRDELHQAKLPEVPGARIICSGDKESLDLRPRAEMAPGGAEQRAGVEACGLFRFGHRLGPGSLPPEWLDARVTIAGAPVQPVFWLLPAPGSDSFQLYRIVARANVAGWDKLLADYIRRLGPPTSINKDPYATARGGQIDNVQAVWDDGVVTITLRKRGDRPEQSTIEYLHRDLAQRIEG